MDINYVEINNIPSVQEREVGFRTVINSGDTNANQNEVLTDILDLFNKCNMVEKSISEIKEVYSVENSYLERKITELENNLAMAAQKYVEINTGDETKTFMVYPDDVTTNNDSFGAYVDTVNHDITMNSSVSTSKLTLYDDVNDITYIPPSLNVALTMTAPVEPTDIIDVYDNNVSNAFNKNNFLYWIRKVEVKPVIDNVICEMVITLPEDIITTRDLNTIILNTYPVNGLDIMNIQYISEGSWMDLECFKTHQNNVMEDYVDIFGTVYERPIIKDAPNLKLNFRNISANQIKIIFRQRHYTTLPNANRLFYIGLKDIQILNNKYTNEYNTFQAVIDFPEKDKIIEFENLDIKLNNGGEISSNLIQYEFYNIDSLSVPHKISTSSPFIVVDKKMLIKFKMFNNETTPNIKHINCIYKAL